jgi:hypothetical protein
MAANRSPALPGWPAIMSLTSWSGGVPGRRDELAQHRCQGAVLAGQLRQLRPGGVEQAHRVAGEVGCLDHPGPGAGVQAGDDVLAVLLVLVAAGRVDRVGDRGRQFGGAPAELPGQDREGGPAGAAGCDVLGVVLDRVVQQRGARHVRVGDR